MAQNPAMLLIACSCGQKMKVPAEALGKTATCVKCGERLRITVDSANPMDAVPGPPTQAGASKGNGHATDSTEILEALSQHGLLTPEQIAEARLIQQDLDRKLWELLIHLGHLSVEDFHKILIKQKGTASIDLANYEIPAEVLTAVPKDLVRRGMIMPVDQLGKLLTLAMACPLDSDTIAEVESTTGLKVKSMLCGMTDVAEAIEEHFPDLILQPARGDYTFELVDRLRPVLRLGEVSKRVFELPWLPPFADTVEELELLAQQPDFSEEHALNVLAADPLATALVLSVANSSAYGFPNLIDGLGMACTLLGAEGILSVVRGAGSEDYYARQDGFDYGKWRDRARFGAECAYGIATAIESQRAVAAFTGGLLHEVGRVAMATALPRSYATVCGDRTRDRLTRTEARVYHATYPQMGLVTTQKLNLPASICEAVHRHLRPNDAKNSKEVVRIVALAAHMARLHDEGQELSFDGMDSLLEALKLSHSDAGEIYRMTESKADQAAH